MKKWTVLLLFIASIASFLVPAPAVQAHSGSSEAYSNISVKDSGINYSLKIDLIEFLQAAIPGGVMPSVSSPVEMNPYLQANRGLVESYLFSHLKLYADGIPLAGSLSQLQVTEEKGRPFASVQLQYPVSKKPDLFTFTYDALFDDIDQGHANYAVLTSDGKSQEFILTYDFREFRLGEMSFIGTAKQFLLHGMEHLFTGYDHILFLISLILGAGSIRRILSVVTAFTFAHSVTLLLAGFHVAVLPEKLVESVIAFSIIYVALNNLFYRNGKHNLWLAFGFGLVHGFGFAGTLSELKLDSGQMVSSLLFFNVGIELGQVLLVLALFPLFQWIRKAGMPRWPIPALSITISLFGLVWFIQRLWM